MRAPSERRERILGFGRSGSGKSSMVSSLAQWIQDTETDSQIYLGDTDRASEAYLDDLARKVVRVEDLDVADFRGWISWAKEVKGVVRRDDWVCVDMVGHAWDAAQGYYYDLNQGDLLADVYFKDKKAKEGDRDGEGMGGAYGINWQMVKRYYWAFMQTVKSMPCHVLCTSAAKEVWVEADAVERNQWKIGWKPEGNKLLVHDFLTVLFCAETPDGWIYTTIKEMGPVGKPNRKMLRGERVDDFVTTYLFGVAGWRP